MTSDEAAIERMALAMKERAARRLGNLCSLENVLVGSLGDAWATLADAALAALLADPPPAVERAVLERLRNKAMTMEEMEFADRLEERLAELAQGESDGKSD